MELAQKALASNKEDTENALKQIAIIKEQNDIILKENESLKLEIKSWEELQAKDNIKLKNNYILGNILVPLMPLTLTTIGLINMGNGNTDRGWILVQSGLYSLIGFELTFQGGHWIFHWW